MNKTLLTSKSVLDVLENLALGTRQTFVNRVTNLSLDIKQDMAILPERYNIWSEEGESMIKDERSYSPEEINNRLVEMASSGNYYITL